MSRTQRNAVLFYGMIRNFEVPSKTLHKHIIAPNEADTFYFGPSYTDKPSNSHYGKFDHDGFMVENPKALPDSVSPANSAGFRENYGHTLKKFVTHNLPFSHFEDEAKSICGTEDWLFNLNPARVLSMFYNIGGAIDSFLTFYNETRAVYNNCIVTRPDLVFYSLVTMETEPGCVQIPQSQGISERGETYDGNAPVYYYKNALTGEYVPGGRKTTFNDQFLLMNISDLKKLGSLYVEIKDMIRRRVPVSPETLFYLALKNRGLSIAPQKEWVYEIFRNDTKRVLSVLNSPELAEIDRYHPSLSRRLSGREL